VTVAQAVAKNRAPIAVATFQVVLIVAVGLMQMTLADRSGFGIWICGMPISPVFASLVLTLIWAIAKRHRLASVITVVGISVATFFCGLHIGGSSDAVSDLRVVTYNIEHGAKGLDNVVATLQNLKPDIALLQEATMTWEPDKRTLEQLETSLPDYRFAIIQNQIVMSRHRILSADLEWLGPRRSKKRANVVKISVRGAPLTVVNVHIMPGGKGGESFATVAAHREQEYRDLNRLLDRIEGPVVLGGDFNGLAYGPNYAALRTRFQDAFAACGQGFGFTLPSVLPLRRIDFLFSSRELEPLRCWVAPQLSSDHRPVVAEYRWRQ